MRLASTATVAAAAALLLLSPLAGAAPCRFAKLFSCRDFTSNPASVEQFFAAVFEWEANFIQNAQSPGLNTTLDGLPLNYTTGETWGPPHPFSAASKESLHVGLLALAANGNAAAVAMLGGRPAVLEALSNKISAYDSFNQRYPAYGCFLPWFVVSNGQLEPSPGGWINPYRTPGLDNGELIWAVYAAAIALNNTGEGQLSSRYMDFFLCQANAAKTIFYEGQGNVAAVTEILNVTAPVAAGNYNTTGGGYLNDPYEGETLTVLLDLFADWDSDPSERELMWEVKRPMLQAATYPVAGSSAGILVQKGFWASSHEQWKTMLLPYFDAPIVKAVFENTERARLYDASVTGMPGLHASINDVTNGSEDIPDYVSPCGIPQIAFQPVFRRDLLTGYGGWAVFLHNSTAGACWLLNYLQAPRMQNPLGATEAINVNGTEISPLTTWDSKVTTVMGMLGGVVDLVRQGLMARQDSYSGTSSYERFLTVISREYGMVFGGNSTLPGSDMPFALPAVQVPTGSLSDWQSCTL